MKTIIIPRIFGGLGNQLFIYAASRRLALVNQAELVLDDVSGFKYDHEFNRHYQLDHFNIPCRKATSLERLEPYSRIRRYIKRSWNQRKPFSKRTYIMQEGSALDQRLLNVQPKGSVYLEGYWQSEDYFIDVESTIRQDLQIKPPTDTVNLAMAAKIQDNKAVAVHIRFFDDPQVDNNNVPLSYYTRAVKKMNCLVPDAHYFVFSDRPESVISHIHLPEGRVTIVGHNLGDEYAYADLWLMTQCQHFIIANSTFSWWGAWLAMHRGKKIIAPRFELLNNNRIRTTWGFKGLLPEKWLKI